MPTPPSGSLCWLWSLSRRFFLTVPGSTLIIIPVTLISQISMLLAFLLPLKVLILAGSNGVPHFFPQSLLQVGRETLIIALSAATLLFYLTHLATEKLIHWISSRGIKHLLNVNQKIILFDNQDDIAAASYRRYTDALANTVFIACVWVSLGFFFPPMCYLLVGYTLFCLALVGTSYRHSTSLRQRIDESFNSIISVLAAIGFILAFLLLVIHFLSNEDQGLLLAIISLLLARQTFQRSNRILSAISNLHNNRLKLNALFFAEHSTTPVDEKQFQFWSLFSPETREAWLRPLLSEHLAIEPTKLTFRWHQTRAKEVAALEIEAYDSANHLTGQYLLRAYGKSPSLPASHEATLLFDESNTNLPALPLLAAGQIGKWPCHIFSLPEGSTTSVPSKHANRYLTTLMAYEPPEDLAARYSHSHPLLWQRLDATTIERLYMAADDNTRPQVNSLEEQLPNILETVRKLPLMIMNPTVNPNTLLIDAENRLWITDWSRWALEPLGSGWPIAPQSLNTLPEALRNASEQRPALQPVKAQDVALTALLFQFEKLCSQQLYLDALAFIPRLFEANKPDLT